jgi:hypothetical protein
MIPTTPDPTRSRRALLVERGRIERLRQTYFRSKRTLTEVELARFGALSAAYQALCWALNDGAMSPSRCYRAYALSRRKGVTR